MGAGKMFFTSLTETPLTGGTEHQNSVWFLRAQAKYKWTAHSEITAGLEIENATTSFSGTATRAVASNSTTWNGFAYQLGYTQRF
jgi:hypothetical protein